MKKILLITSIIGLLFVSNSYGQDTTFTLHKNSSDSLVYFFHVKKNKDDTGFSIYVKGLEGSKKDTTLSFDIKSSDFKKSLKSLLSESATASIGGISSKYLPDSLFTDTTSGSKNFQKEFDDESEKIYRQVIETSVKEQQLSINVLDSLINRAFQDEESIVVGKFRIVPADYIINVYAPYDDEEPVRPGILQDNIEKIKGIDETEANDTANVKEGNKQTGYKIYDQFKIDSISIEIRDGFIKDLRICGKYQKNNEESKFKNVNSTGLGKKCVPISLTRYDDRIDDLICDYKNENSRNVIYLGDVLTYEHKVGRNFVPDNADLLLTKDNNPYYMKSDVSLNHQIDFKIYSDALALLAKKPNGIIQFEGSAKLIINTGNMRNKNWFLFQHTGAFLNYSQFDSKNINTISRDTVTNDSLFTGKYKINRQELLQKSFLTFGGYLNIFKKYYRTTESYTELNFGWSGALSKNLVINKENDTLVKDIFINTYYLSLVNNIQVLSNFGIILEANCLFQTLVQPVISNHDYRTILQTFGTLYFNPFSQSSKNSRIFLRGGVFTDFSDRGNIFTRLQIGYSGSISQYIKKGK